MSYIVIQDQGNVKRLSRAGPARATLVLVPPPFIRADRRNRQPAGLRQRECIRILKQALAEDRLVVHYQPIVEARSRRPVSVEALLRWRDDHGDNDPLPGLVKAAERSPVIFQLERWAIERSCREAASWPSALRDLRINLNVSAREFDRGGFALRLTRMVRRSGVEPRRVTLEITETSALRDPETVAGLLDGLKGQGFQIWLDDFGTGHSSLAWLRLLPIDGLKIPAEFVLDVHARPRVATITSALIRLAHDLGLHVVGEGVEAKADLEWLIAAGCDQVQGFLLHSPMPAEEIRRLAVV